MTDCWEWPGDNANGYARSSKGSGRIMLHRHIWELRWSDKLHPGDVIRHKCDNPICINPDHLEIGSQVDNIDDMWNRGRARGRYSGMDHCTHGHPFTSENTYWAPRDATRSRSTELRRQCRTCNRLRAKRNRDLAKAKRLRDEGRDRPTDAS